MSGCTGVPAGVRERNNTERNKAEFRRVVKGDKIETKLNDAVEFYTRTFLYLITCLSYDCAKKQNTIIILFEELYFTNALQYDVMRFNIRLFKMKLNLNHNFIS